jgi:hypothetical protein
MTAERTVSEWMNVMLGEIARKKAEEAEMRAEERRREESPQHGEPNARSI